MPVRYRTNDTSYESLGELLINNPAGMLVERDELVSLLSHLDRDDQAVARGFYLSGWSGTQPYTFDRIVRGHLHIEAACISVLGNTQPVRISEYVRRANAGGAGGDGLIQRFGLMVWPDASTEWKNVDEYPDTKIRERVWNVFSRLAKLDETVSLRIGRAEGSIRIHSHSYGSMRPRKTTSLDGAMTSNADFGQARYLRLSKATWRSTENWSRHSH